MSDTLETSSSTLYRLVRDLVAIGMLESTVESRYRLGPFFIEYYRRLRLNDPLIKYGTQFLEPLRKQVPVPCAVVLARLYNGDVMCVAEDVAPDADLAVSYELGRPMPILHGATSKAVLSTMAPKVAETFLAKVVKADAGQIAEVKIVLEGIRKTGIIETRGEVDSGLAGIAAPVCNKGLGVNASVSVILSEANLNDNVRASVYTSLAAAAKMIENYMKNVER